MAQYTDSSQDEDNGNDDDDDEDFFGSNDDPSDDDADVGLETHISTMRQKEGPPVVQFAPPPSASHTRAHWNALWESQKNQVFEDDAALLLSPSPLAKSGADVGRFVLLPLNAYPQLQVQRPPDQPQHIGWALKIKKVTKSKGKEYQLGEKGESATQFPTAAVSQMVVLSE